MSVTLYMDHHVPRAITLALRVRGVNVLTTQDDGTEAHGDAALLNRATELNRVLFSQDDDFLREAQQRIALDIPFPGIVYAHQLRVSIGQCVQDLELITKLGEPHELKNQVIFLPL